VFAVFGMVTISFVIPNLSKAAVSLDAIFGILDTEITIDVKSELGLRPNNFQGQIKFTNVNFSYPTRPEELVLKNFNMLITPGKKIGLVGESGCGKSTIFQLLLRFYEI